MSILTTGVLSFSHDDPDVTQLPHIDANAPALTETAAAKSSVGSLSSIRVDLESDLYGRVIAPRDDLRGERKLFLALRDHFIQQYGAAHLMEINELASDCLELKRLRSLRELMWQPHVDDETSQNASKYIENQRHLSLLAKAARFCAAGAMHLTKEQAKALAPLLAKWVQHQVAGLAEIDAEKAAKAGKLLSLLSDPEDEKLDEQFRADVLRFSPVQQLLLDPAQGIAALSGEVILSQMQLVLIKEILDELVERATHEKRSLQPVYSHFRAKWGEKVATLRDDATNLGKIHRLIEKLEASIRRRKESFEGVLRVSAS